MGGSLSWRRSDLSRAPAARGRSGTLSGLGGFAAALVTALVLMVGAVLAVIFAATLAVVMALATALLGLSALVWRMRRGPAQPVRIERRAANSWIAYNWDGRQITSGH